MKKILSVILCFLLLMSVFGCKGASKKTLANMEPIKIKFATAVPNGEMVAEYILKDWMAAVTERAGGKISFDFYPNGKLGSYVEIIEQVDIGAVDMSIGEPSLFEQWCPEISMFYAPMICTDYDHLLKCLYGKPAELVSQAMSERTNTYILGSVSAGARVIASKRPLNTLNDMKGLIIRSPESQVFIDTFTLFGMSPTPMAMNEMYEALQLGVVEGCDCPAQSLYEGGYHKVTGNICKTRHMYALGTLSANEKFWDGLPSDAQKLMIDIWDELKGGFNKRVIDAENDYYGKFETAGTLVTEFNDKKAFKDIAEPYWSKKASTIGGKAPEILNAINELRN